MTMHIPILRLKLNAGHDTGRVASPTIDLDGHRAVGLRIAADRV